MDREAPRPSSTPSVAMKPESTYFVPSATVTCLQSRRSSATSVRKISVPVPSRKASYSFS